MKSGKDKIKIKPPGGVPTAHSDTYARDLLPDTNLQHEYEYSGVPELTTYADHQNAGVELLDKMVAGGFGGLTVLHYEDKSWTYNELL